VESIDKLIYTLEILSSALSTRDKNEAVEAITLLLQQFTATFGRATRIFLAILFFETLKGHILSEEFEEASGGALALLAKLRALNTAAKQSAGEYAPTGSEAFAEEVLDEVIITETAPRPAIPLARVAGARAWGGWHQYTLTVNAIRGLPAYQAGLAV